MKRNKTSGTAIRQEETGGWTPNNRRNIYKNYG